MNFVAIDFETANERRDSACAIGWADVRDNQIVDVGEVLIRPRELRFEYMNVQIHGIREEDVLDQPFFSELWPDIWTKLQGRLVVAHNASFDMSVLRGSLYSNQVVVPRLPYLCSMKISRRAWPDLPSHGLGYLAELHAIALQHHNAASDAQAAAELLLQAGRERQQNDAPTLAKSLGVSIGEVISHDKWKPSSETKKR
jgi:DNA polymerase III subunit epsilon